MLYFDQIVELAGQLVNNALAGIIELETARTVIRDYNKKAIVYRSTGETGTFNSKALIAEMNKLYKAGLVLLENSVPVSVHGSSIYSRPETADQVALCSALGLNKNKEGFHAFHFAHKVDREVKGINWVRATIRN